MPPAEYERLKVKLTSSEVQVEYNQDIKRNDLDPLFLDSVSRIVFRAAIMIVKGMEAYKEGEHSNPLNVFEFM